MKQNGLGPLTFHHVGIITSDIGAATAVYESFGYKASETFQDPIQKVKIVLMTQTTGPMIELIQPDGETSPAHAWLKRIRGGSYHTCYSCSNLEKEIEQLRDQDFFLISGPDPAVAFHGRPVAFLFNSVIGLVELVQW